MKVECPQETVTYAGMVSLDNFFIVHFSFEPFRKMFFSITVTFYALFHIKGVPELNSEDIKVITCHAPVNIAVIKYCKCFLKALP